MASLHREYLGALVLACSAALLGSDAMAQPNNQPAAFRDCADCPEIVLLPAGSFTMGSSADEKQRDADEGPQHDVTIAKPFAVGKFELTVDQFAAFETATGYDAGSECWTLENGEAKKRSDRSWRNPGFAQTGSHPVACVSWNDAKAYVAWLSKLTGKTYRLLSESEWEYAARAGTTTPFWWGSSITTSQADYGGNFTYGSSPKGEHRNGTVPVGSFSANGFGLFDMHGNVWEGVEDCYGDSYDNAPTNGSAKTTDGCKLRVLRGGSWDNSPGSLRAASRNRLTPDIRNYSSGFRVARTLTP